MRTLVYGCVIAMFLITTCGPGTARADHIMSLEALLNGGALVDGDLTYTNFELTADVGTVSPNLGDIWVEGIGYGLEFSSPNEFFLFPGNDSVILEFGYDIVASDPNNATRFNRIGTDFGAGSAFVPGQGLVDLFVDFETTSGQFLGTSNSVLDPVVRNRTSPGPTTHSGTPIGNQRQCRADHFFRQLKLGRTSKIRNYLGHPRARLSFSIQHSGRKSLFAKTQSLK